MNTQLAAGWSSTTSAVKQHRGELVDCLQVKEFTTHGWDENDNQEQGG